MLINFPWDSLPPLPQINALIPVAAALWNEADVAALWLGGSFARGAADEFSDVDLRVAVHPNAGERWRQPDLSLLFQDAVVGQRSFPLGPGGLLHHLALVDGDIFDLWVQTTEQAPFQETVLVLGCRDAAFGQRLEEAKPALSSEAAPADPAVLRDAVVGFWTDTLKHRKVLHRGLDLVAQTGIGLERALLVRLWSVLATGRDGADRGVTIHSMTEIARTVQAAQGRRALGLTGLPLTNRREIMAAIEANRDEMARVGRGLSERFGFEYPEVLEQTARRTWQQYRQGTAGGAE